MHNWVEVEVQLVLHGELPSLYISFLPVPQAAQRQCHSTEVGESAALHLRIWQMQGRNDENHNICLGDDPGKQVDVVMCD